MKNKKTNNIFLGIAIASLLIGVILLVVGLTEKSGYSITFTMYNYEQADYATDSVSLVGDYFDVTINISTNILNKDVTNEILKQLNQYNSKITEGNLNSIWSTINYDIETRPSHFMGEFNLMDNIVHAESSAMERWNDFVSLAFNQLPTLNFASQIIEISIGSVLVLVSAIIGLLTIFYNR